MPPQDYPPALQVTNFVKQSFSDGHLTGTVTKANLAPKRGSHINLGMVVQAGIDMFLPENVTVDGQQCSIILQNNITGVSLCRVFELKYGARCAVLCGLI